MSSKQVNGVSKTPSQLDELSAIITRNASVVSEHLKANNLPQPSFNSDGPSIVIPRDSPQNVVKAQQELIAAALQVSQLAMGPSEFLPNLALGFQYISCLTWLCQYDIFQLVPLNDTISYADLAAAAGVPEQRIKNMVRMAMTNTLFQEHSDGTRVAHSAASALLARDPDVYTYATYMCNKSAPMAMHLAAAHRRWGADTMRTYETAYNAAFETDLPFFDHLGRDKTRMSEFAAYMRQVRSSDAVDLKHLVSGFPWQSIQDAGLDGGLVVDVGGSTGGAAITLAKAFPQLSFIVQDLHSNAENGEKAAAESLPADIKSRITFQGHDFMDPQPVRGANVYLLRMILHDWPDTEATAIIKNLVAAMDPAVSRLLIMDTVLPKPGSVPVSVERIARARDMTMLQCFNSKERHLEDWSALLEATGTGAELVSVTQPFGSAMSVMEIRVGTGTAPNGRPGAP